MRIRIEVIGFLARLDTLTAYFQDLEYPEPQREQIQITFLHISDATAADAPPGPGATPFFVRRFDLNKGI